MTPNAGASLTRGPVYAGRRAVALSRFQISSKNPVLPGDMGTVEVLQSSGVVPFYVFVPDNNPSVKIWFEPWLNVGFRLV